MVGAWLWTKWERMREILTDLIQETLPALGCKVVSLVAVAADGIRPLGTNMVAETFSSGLWRLARFLVDVGWHGEEDAAGCGRLEWLNVGVVIVEIIQ